MAKKREIEIGDTKVCSPDYGVTQIVTRGGTKHVSRRTPCEECPWREDVPTGVFPAEAYRTSAYTAHDAAMSTFACHMAGKENPATCAGFLLRHAENNLSIRFSLSGERIDLDRISDGGLPVYRSYREMAIANGVDPDDPCLRNVRANGDIWDQDERRWRPACESEE